MERAHCCRSGNIVVGARGICLLALHRRVEFRGIVVADTPLVDVLLPVYNGARTIGEAVESLLQQTILDIRVIVVDDGSTDETPTLLRKMERADRRVQIVRQSNNGIVSALNRGLEFCTAQFLARQDADDISVKDRFEVQLNYLRSNPDCIAVSGAIRHIDGSGRFLDAVSYLGPPEMADPSWVPAIEPYLPPFLMTYRAVAQALGGYRYVHYSEDSDLFWRMQEVGRLHNMTDVIGFYRMHGDSVSSRSLRNGRLMSLFSQLGALSAIRRRKGGFDLSFPKDDIPAFIEAANSLAELVALAARSLSQEEVDHLEIAIGAKLLELSSYRPYEPDIEDCRFIRSAFRKHSDKLRFENQAALARSLCGTAARLLHRGRIREAGALVDLRHYPATLGRLAFRALSPPALRYQLRKALVGRHASKVMK
jgi:glycosyltransferase involved in cell wall biosynthesis